ncbi:hypothetical protein HDV00_006602 [Rhizophlyctis rosea]|nr:hypothetical protein HDV00_006602 [Rhizophlyctis rosea]
MAAAIITAPTPAATTTAARVPVVVDLRALQDRVGYYPGDYPVSFLEEDGGRIGSGKRGRRSDPLVINATDLKRLTQQLEGADMDAKITKMMKEDRTHLHTLSQTRIQNWHNTIAGARRAKLAAREKRLREEEEKRLEMDREYAAEEQERRRKAIERAKEMRWFEGDDVKGFHGRVVLFEVLKVSFGFFRGGGLTEGEENVEEVEMGMIGVYKLWRETRGGKLDFEGARLAGEREAEAAQRSPSTLIERDLQLAHKASILEKERNQEDTYQQDVEAALRAQLEADARAVIAERRERKRVQREQMKQAEEKREKERVEKESLLLERTHLHTLATEHHADITSKAAKQKASRAAMAESLRALQADLRHRKELEREKEKEEEERRNAWAERKTRQIRTKRELERQWRVEAQQTRDRIGEAAFVVQQSNEAELEARVAKAVAKREEEDKRKEAEKRRKKMAEREELKVYYEDYKRRVAEEREHQKAMEREELAEHLRIHADQVAADKARKEELLRRGKELQKSHLDKMAEQSTHAAVQHALQTAEAHTLSQQTSLDRTKLRDYMLRTAAEPWAQDNTRLQTYVKREVARDEKAASKVGAYNKMLDTGLRLGLTCTRYEWPRVRRELKMGRVEFEGGGGGGEGGGVWGDEGVAGVAYACCSGDE